jgi:hypothetical protein
LFKFVNIIKMAKAFNKNDFDDDEFGDDTDSTSEFDKAEDTY